MSIGPSDGIVAGAAGSPLAQSAGAEIARARQIAAMRQRKTAEVSQAAGAEGITQADGQNLQTEDRDGDGRQAWQNGPGRVHDDSTAEQPPTNASPCNDLDEHALDLSG